MPNISPADLEDFLTKVRRQARRGLLPKVSSYIRECPHVYFITLTTSKPIDKYRLTSARGQLLHQLNQDLFGSPYKQGQRHRLATIFVHEETYAQQLHTHGLLAVPEPAISPRTVRRLPHLETVIKSIWLGLDDGGEPQAQDVQLVTDYDGVDAYVQKRLWSPASFDYLDLLNTRLPKILARTDRIL